METTNQHFAGAFSELDQTGINSIRVLAMDAVQRANSGHPGTPMALAPLAHVLWTRHLKHNPRDPAWPDRDRFVLSVGHASMLLYAMLYLTGYNLSLKDLKNFRQWESKTPGHPEYGMTPGVETSTGPLGQGFGNGVGMAIAERWLATRFNRPGYEIVDHFTYAFVSDGDLMEGVSHEAASLAGHLRLGKLIHFYDDNHITIEGSTSLAFSEDVAARFEAYGWHVERVPDRNDVRALDTAIHAARRETERPSLIIVRTHIAFGSPNKQDSAEAHGAPLGEEEVRLTKEALHYPYLEPFQIPDYVVQTYREAVVRGAAWRDAWQEVFSAYAQQYPDLAAEWERMQRGELPDGWDAGLPSFSAAEGSVATRAASGKVLNAIAARVPELIGGAADLAPSTNTYIQGGGDFEAGSYGARNFHFGVREHGMGSILNGMALHGGVRPYGSTFLIFSDYMRPPIRMAALMEQPVIYVFTHDSVGLGEDGPTHQPVEQMASLRAIPGLLDLRPADATETVEAWRIALEHRSGPVFLALTRQKVPTIDRVRYALASGVARGAYILAEAENGKPDVILIASGSEVHLALEAREILAREGIQARVVSMPSWTLFRRQPDEYCREVLPPTVTARVSVEAAGTLGWRHWIGPDGEMIAVLDFGASAPAKQLFEALGFTAENVVARARAALGDESMKAARPICGPEAAGPARLGVDEDGSTA
jgi:transketolase